MSFIAIVKHQTFSVAAAYTYIWGIYGQTVNPINHNSVIVKLICLGMQSLHYENEYLNPLALEELNEGDLELLLMGFKIWDYGS